MRVAVWHNLPTGGAARTLTNHINGLIKSGHEVELWASNPLIDGFITIPESVKLHQIPLKRNEHTSFSDKWKSYFFDKDSNILAMEEHCKSCAEGILAGKFDVVYVNACYFYAVPFIGKYLFGKVKTALNLGEPFRFFYEARPDLVWQAPPAIKTVWKSRSWMKSIATDFWINHKYRVQVREEKINAAFYDKILVNSYYSAETAMRVYNRDTIVNYTGINTEMFQSIANKTIKNYVIGLGNLYDNKNPELAIRAIAKIEEKIRPELYWVANMTDPLMIDTWIALAKELKVAFIIKKMVSDAELVVLLNEAICLLYTSKLEPFGMAPHEANLCGTPAVGVAQAGIRETIIDGLNGFLCQATPIDLASKVKLLIENPVLRNEMGEKGIQYVKENWNLAVGDKNLQKNLFEEWN
jgi:glycosyltransferase involved in cell wall biosynthesis